MAAAPSGGRPVRQYPQRAPAGPSRKFAGAENRFAGVSWTPSPGGMPVLEGSVAWLECSVADEHRAGDHHIVVVRLHHTGSSGGGPLMRYRGRYARLAAPGEGLASP
ncbi:flavin reductase family protein [Streptomyces avidinii]|uniref:flavin reductase family protein n=1 Tax=Streptomyces avidinii TaxID=1895 RepID=UPI003864F8AA